MSLQLPLSEVRPTQLYLSSEKLADVLAWFDADDPEYDPLPVFDHEDRWYLADGHTRAFAAVLSGAETLDVYHDTAIREEYDIEVYLTCIDWCDDAGIERVRDLCGRVVEPETYETEWIDRCQALETHSGA